MDFRLLGPLELWDGDRLVQPRSWKLRTLLALLLLDANRPLPRDDLIDQLWRGAPPPSARASLHAYVYRLRQLLNGARTGPGAALRTQTDRYLLEVPPELLDLHRFERLAADGRAAIRDGHLDLGVERLRAALALWRGPALADIDLEAVQSRSRRLENGRMAALEQCLSAELALGRHDAVIAELEQLVSDHPLREGLWARLVAALYRAGRRGDALSAYSRARATLVAELGVEPGAELQRLQQAVLEGKEVPFPVEEAPPRHGAVAGQGPGAAHRTTGAWPVPAQLPADTADFTGRDATVGRLRSLLGGSGGRGNGARRWPVVCAIFGSAGVGKTTLAVHVAHHVRSAYPDGQLFVDLRGTGNDPARPAETLAAFLRALGVDPSRLPSGEAERAGLFRTVTADRRVLVVLDNARDAAQITPLLPAGRGCAALITSREAAATLPGVRLVDLDVLPEREALAFLGRVEGAGRVRADPAAATAIVRRCGRLPLALRVVGARLAANASLPLSVVADRLADERRRLSELDLDELSVRASLALSYRFLDRPPPRPSEPAHGQEAGAGGAARAFRLLGIAAGVDIALPAAARLLDVLPALAEPMLDRLVRARLLDLDAGGRYRMHDLVRLYARERAAAEEHRDDQAAAHTRLLRWYLGTVQRAARLLRPKDDPVDDLGDEEAGQRFDRVEDAVAWFRAERLNLIDVVRQAVDRPDQRLLGGRLTVALRWLFRSQGYSEDWDQVLHRALGACRQLGDRHLVAWVLNELAWGCRARGDLDGVIRHSGQAKAAFGAGGHRYGEFGATINLGVAHHMLGRLQAAMALYEEALVGTRSIAYRRGEGYALANMAAAARDLADVGSAVGYGNQALDVFVELGDRHGQVDALNDLAASYRAARRFGDAMAAHERSLAILRELADHPRHVEALLGLARTHLAAGRDRAAAAAADQVLALLPGEGTSRSQAQALQELGDELHAGGQVAAAHRCWLQADAALTATDRAGATATHPPATTASAPRCACASHTG